ncbi:MULTISPECIES: 3-dehydroquinate synthase [Sutcliffiella]|nr:MULTISPECIES: 3-dehydroquinate synthase [Sutcliffiella]MED4017294.1 3-dehydroquinate synthase [Sutcliffiella cohnii]WBL13481.1 3-dehydroquinate synthase [Sutcliffiella sp. NC1]
MPNNSKVMKVQTETKTYSIYVEENASLRIKEVLHSFHKNVSKILIVTDSNVAPLYLEKVSNLVQEYNPIQYILPNGENAKSFEHFYELQTYALEMGLDRNSLIIALGGGVVGDIAGFVAATFMRGIRFIQMPTTLLAHDSAVGGKVAINHPLGKNMIGAFYQPEAVIYDTDFLKSLPESEIRSGFAEVLKHSVIRDSDFYNWIESNITELSQMEGSNLVKCIEKGISIKASIVSNDEKENGIRAILNFGHTVGHAIEKNCGYGKMTHGDAVAFGMLVAAKISERINGFANFSQLSDVISRFNYPSKIPTNISIEQILKSMKKDKKSQNGHIHMVLIKKFGEVYVQPVSDEIIRETLVYFLPE